MEPDRDWNSGNGGKTRLGAAPRIKRRHATSIFGRFGLGLRPHGRAIAKSVSSGASAVALPNCEGHSPDANHCHRDSRC